MASIRAQKKQLRRRAILDGAMALFEEKGYDATTIEEITRHAACSPRTFFQYFASKEELLLVAMEDFWQLLVERLSARPAGTSTLRSVSEWMRSMTEEFMSGGQPFLQFLDHEKENTRISLQARLQLFSLSRIESVLVPELAKDMGLPPTALEARLIARAAAAVFELYDTDPSLQGSDPHHFAEKAILALEGAQAALVANAGAGYPASRGEHGDRSEGTQ